MSPRTPKLENVVLVAWLVWVVAGFAYLVHGFVTARYLWWLP